MQRYARWLSGEALSEQEVYELNLFLCCTLPPYESATGRGAGDVYASTGQHDTCEAVSEICDRLPYVVAARHAAVRACGDGGGDSPEATVFDVRDPPDARAATLLAMGWPDGHAPATGALVKHMLDCMEFHVAFLATYEADALEAARALDAAPRNSQGLDDSLDDTWLEAFDDCDLEPAGHGAGAY